MKHIKILFILVLISLTLLASGCEEKMSAEEIATKIQEREANLEDYSGTMHVTSNFDGEKEEEEIQIMYKKPNLVKTLDLEEGNKTESVSDGEFIWTYDSGTNTVTKMKLPDEPLLNEIDLAGLIGNLMNESEISMLGTEEVDGRSAYVIEARPKTEENESELTSQTKIWIDKETWMVLRTSMYDNKGNLITDVEIHDLKINTGIPDSEFKFEVPEGAEVKTIDLEEELKLTENLSLEEARQQASFEILTPEYVPDGYVLNSTSIYNDSNIAPEGQRSETVTLTYLKGNEEFGILETVYEGEGYTSTQGAEEVMINGKVGKYLNEFGNEKMLVWKLGEVEITLYGSPEKAELLKIAESIHEPITESLQEPVTESLQESFTEFYILGPEGTAENYPTDYVLGENGTVIIGIINHEQKPVNYTMEVWLENESLPLPADQKNIFLGNNETWEKAVTITPPFEGKDMSLQFLLYNDDKKDTFEGDTNMPYRDLHLWINVAQNLSENASTPLMAV
jgi:outer membrane lipoprotein-sorting protein